MSHLFDFGIVAVQRIWHGPASVAWSWSIHLADGRIAHVLRRSGRVKVWA